LGPVLEKVTTEFNGKVRLVKINSDENPQVAQAFEISSIPAVFAFKDGQAVDKFTGALPEAQVRDFFTKLAPSPADESAMKGAAALQNQDFEQARFFFEEAITHDSNHSRANAGMGALLIEEGKIDDAESILKQFPKEPSAIRQLARIHFIRDGSDDEAVANALTILESETHEPSQQAEAHYVLGCRTALQGEWETALAHFLTTVSLDRSVRNDGGRLGALDVFNVLGSGHEITREYTQRLSSLLF
jgi:putative thioredoxin